MTPLAWGMACVLAAVVGLAVAQGVSLAGWAWLVVTFTIWVGAGLAVRRDARRLGFADPEWAGALPVVLGLAGLMYWFGYRRGRSDERA